MEMMWTAEIKILKNRVVFPVSKSPFCWKGSQFRLLWWSTTLQESTKTFKIRSRQLKFNLCLCKWKENQRVPMANLWINYFRNENWNYRISPSNIARGDYFLFRAKRGRLFEGRRLFPILFPGSRALKIYVFFFFFQKKNLPKQTEDGLFKGFKFSSLNNFQSLNRHWSCRIRHCFNLTRSW